MALCKHELNPNTGLPDEMGHRRPLDYFRVPESERAARIKHDDDLCVIDGKVFLVRAHLPIRVLDDPVHFGWGLWARVNEALFRRYLAAWGVDASDEPPIPGVLSAEFTQYAPLYEHAVDLFLGPAWSRPRIRLHPSGNRLYREQEEGITAARRYELFRELMPWLFA